MNGKSPICDGDLVEALTASLEPRFRASAAMASEDPGMRFLLDRGILSKGNESTVLCDRCERNCELPIEVEGEQRFFVCPTGYVERPGLVSADDVPVYRFDFSAFCAAFANKNGLRQWGGDKDLGRAFHPVAKGQRVGKRVVALYALALDARDVSSTLSALKSRLQCDKLVVVTAQSDHVQKELADALAANGICLVRLGDLLGKQTFDIDLAESGDAPPPPDAYCRVVTHEGREFLTQQQYRALFAKRRDFNMFIDAFEKKCWKRDTAGKTTEAKLTPAELQILSSYIESGKIAKPTKFDSSMKVFETARRKADVKIGRYKWQAFTTHRTPADRMMKEHQFTPPSDFKYCLATPSS